jgi:type I restriction enzyme, S subunit
MSNGYKETKIGIIPENWDVVKLGDIASFKNGANFSKKDVGSGIPMINVVNMYSERPYVIFENLERVNNISTSYFLKDGDILFVRSSLVRDGVGWSAVVKNYHEPVAYCGFIIRARIEEENVLNNYLGYLLRSHYGRSKLVSLSGTVTITNIGQDGLSRFFFPLPTLKEQKKIFEILTTVDDAIEKSAALIEETHQLKKGLMQKLFTEGIGHTRFKETKIGKIPEEWEMLILNEAKKEIIDYRGKTPPKSDKGIFLVRTSNIRDGKIKFNEMHYVAENTYSNWFKKGNPTNQHVLITTEAPLGEVAVFPKQDFFSIGQRIVALNFDVNFINHIFFKYYCMSSLFQNQLTRRSVGTTVQGILSKELLKIPIAYPSIDEQCQIAQILSEVDAKIEKEEATKAELEQLKKGLMQVLLTGKVRVKA